MASPRRFLPATIMAGALVLAACGGSSDEGSADVADTEPAPVETEPAATEPVVTEPVATEPVVTEPVVTEPVVTEPVVTEPVVTEPVVDGSCLVGAWIVTEDELNGFYDSVEGSFPEGTPAPTFEIAGNVLLTFTETDYIYVADFDLTLDVAGQTGTGDTSGMVSGTWEVIDGLLTTTVAESDLDVVVSIGGVTLSGNEFANGLLDSAPINDAAFDCAGPTINFQAGVEGVPGHEVLLTPA